MPTTFNVSVAAINTHWDLTKGALPYYGALPDAMTGLGSPEPWGVSYVRGCVTTALKDHKKEADACIVVLPEFMLQPRNGAYTAPERQYVGDWMKNILNEIGESVLVVFGTVVWHDTASGSPVFYNDLLYGVGKGPLLHSGKDYLSQIDLVDSSSLTTDIGWENGALYKKNGTPPLHWDQSAGQFYYVNFLKKRIGFSVCLDYAKKVLLGRLGKNNPVDIHIVSSCGMKFESGEGNICEDKGKVVVCDATGELSSIHQVNGSGQSKQRNTMLTTEHNIQGVPTKIRRAQMTLYI